MSIKENIDMVKEELNSEEKFFEKAVITEKFIKKYKNIMIGSVVAIVVFVSANIVYDANQQSIKDDANTALLMLEKNPKDTVNIAKLKSLSPVMYDVWLYAQAITNKDFVTLKELKGSKTILLDDLVSYELAQNSASSSDLDDYALKQGAIYKDLALVQSAILLMNDSKLEEAHSKLMQIGEESPLSQVAKVLAHYGVK